MTAASSMSYDRPVGSVLAMASAVTMSGTLKSSASESDAHWQIANDTRRRCRMPINACDVTVQPSSGPRDIGGTPSVVPLTRHHDRATVRRDIDIDFVADPVAISIATGADYKRVVVTVASVGLGAPPVTMSTLVAPPSKPAADRAQVIVQVNDAINFGTPAGIGVDLKNGATGLVQHDVTGPMAGSRLPTCRPAPPRATTTT